MRAVLLVLVLLLCTPMALHAQESLPPADVVPTAEARTKAGYTTDLELGPTSVQAALLDGDRITKPIFSLGFIDRGLKPWFDWKGRINTRHHFQFGMDYQGLYQHVDRSPGRHEAVGGILRIYGEWTLVNACQECHKGSLVWKVEQRHGYGEPVVPQNLGSEFGYGGITGTLFSDIGWFLANFYWKQRFGDHNQGVVLVGQLDPLDYVDVSGLANPFTAWQNLSVLVNPTIPLPNQGLGIAAGWQIGYQGYVIAGFSDANALPTRDFTQTWNDFETFKHVELGWTKSRKTLYTQSAHVTFWHQDAREASASPDAWGWALTGTTPLARGLSAAVRAGWSSAAVGFSERHAGALLQYSFNQDADAIGLGVAWDDVWGALQEDQVSAEFFARAQFAQNFAFTPSVQYIRNPAFNPTQREAWVLGLRFRITL